MLAIVAVILAVGTVLVSVPEMFLRVRDLPTPCDAIVLLGGATGERNPVALDLYRRRIAPLIIITGNGDCLDNFRVLAARGVSTNAMIVECASKSTKENAQAVSLIGREKHITNIVLVTSWFHSRRAVCTFRKFAPELGVRSSVAEVHAPFRYEWRHVASEYAKIVYYAIRWRVPPWT
jgi:uncharacterized SAM-binding protein YcdF (DUF218 family)